MSGYVVYNILKACLAQSQGSELNTREIDRHGNMFLLKEIDTPVNHCYSFGVIYLIELVGREEKRVGMNKRLRTICLYSNSKGWHLLGIMEASHVEDRKGRVRKRMPYYVS